MPSFEVLLLAGVIGLYLLDSVLLLCIDELVFVKTRGGWDFACPGSDWQLLGRSPYLPNPLTPAAPQFRVLWPPTEDQRRADTCAGLQEFLDTVTALRYLVVLLLVVLAAGLPLALFVLASDAALLVLLGVIYLTILVMLAYTFHARAALGVSAGHLARLAFDALVCPPFALNLVRKISLCHPPGGDPIDFAAARLDTDTRERFFRTLRDRVEEGVELEDAESPRHIALRAYRERLAAYAPHLSPNPRPGATSAGDR